MPSDLQTDTNSAKPHPDERNLWEQTISLLRDLLSGDERDNRNLLDKAFHTPPNNPTHRLSSNGAPDDLAIEWVRKLWNARCVNGQSPLTILLTKGYEELRAPRPKGFRSFQEFLDALDRPCREPSCAPSTAGKAAAQILGVGKHSLTVLIGMTLVLAIVVTALWETERSNLGLQQKIRCEAALVPKHICRKPIADHLCASARDTPYAYRHDCWAPISTPRFPSTGADTRPQPKCDTIPPVYAELWYGAALFSILSGCLRQYSAEENALLAGLADALIHECGLPRKFEERLSLLQALDRYGYAPFIGQRLSIDIIRAPDNRKVLLYSYAEGAQLMDVVGCHNTLSEHWAESLRLYWLGARSQTGSRANLSRVSAPSAYHIRNRATLSARLRSHS